MLGGSEKERLSFPSLRNSSMYCFACLSMLGNGTSSPKVHGIIAMRSLIAKD
jgi:hypothetical protein